MQAKDTGDIETLREIAEDPEGFLLRKGWANLDFSDKEDRQPLCIEPVRIERGFCECQWWGDD